MSERRMFHRALVESDLFLDLPIGAQALYFHIGMHADDDGFNNCSRQIARKLRRPKRELQALVDAQLLLEFDGIVVLRHWRVANVLRTDRMKPLQYPDISKQIYVLPNREYSLEPQQFSPTLFELRRQFLSVKCQRKVREDNITEDNINEDKINQDKTDYDPVLTCEAPLDYLESLKDIPLSLRGNNDFDRSEK